MERVAAYLGPQQDAIQQAIVEALRRDYEANAERHDPALGDDSQSFGLLVAHNARAFLEEELERLPGVETRRPMNSFEIEVNGVVLHPCKAGSSHTDDVHAAVLDGSLTRQRFVSANAAQLTLFHSRGDGGWINRPGPEPRLRHLVIAHSGNPQDALCWVAIGAPQSTGRTGSPWHWVEEIYRSDANLEPVTTLPTSRPMTRPFTEIEEPEPVLALREQGDQHGLDPSGSA